MKNQNYDYFKYHEIVWRTGKENTKVYYSSDRNSWLSGIFSAIFSGIVVPYLLWKFANVNMPNIWILVLIVLISAVVGFLLSAICYYISQIIYYVPAKLYFDVKKKLEKLSWKDIKISYKPIKEMDKLLAYRIEVENNKLEKCFFHIELHYLEVDSKCEYHKNEIRPRMLVWVDDYDSNKQDGIVIQNKNDGNFSNTRSWELLRVIGENKEKNYKISYCEFDQNNSTKPPTKYVPFSDYAKGELIFHGKYVYTSIGTGTCGSSHITKEEISEECVYKFVINIAENKVPSISFEKGIFDYHLPLE
jgi:hypothetical protein